MEISILIASAREAAQHVGRRSMYDRTVDIICTSLIRKSATASTDERTIGDLLTAWGVWYSVGACGTARFDDVCSNSVVHNWCRSNVDICFFGISD